MFRLRTADSAWLKVFLADHLVCLCECEYEYEYGPFYPFSQDKGLPIHQFDSYKVLYAEEAAYRLDRFRSSKCSYFLLVELPLLSFNSLFSISRPCISSLIYYLHLFEYTSPFPYASFSTSALLSPKEAVLFAKIFLHVSQNVRLGDSCIALCCHDFSSFGHWS